MSSLSLVPMITLSSVFFVIVSIIVLGGLGLAGYLVFKAFYSDYKYRSFSLPISEEYFLKNEDESEKIINPIKESKFKIEQSTGIDIIDESRKTSEEMFKKVEERRKLRKKKEAKRIQKELEKKA